MSRLSIIKRLRIEPFIFLFFFSNAIQGITITQLAQDKICLFKYRQTQEYCSELSEQISTESEFDFKSRILSDVTEFNLFKTLISTFPVIFWSLFLGSWADRHSSAPKILLCLGSIAAVLETTILLINSVYFELGLNFIIEN